MKESNTQPVMDRIEKYRANWKSHVLRMPAQESHSKFSVTKETDDDLWGYRNRALGLRGERIIIIVIIIAIGIRKAA
jgi:hypothetical protein